MDILEYRNIEKSFFGTRVLHGVNFSLKAGHVLGLVGENGAGKSTLMNILGGVLKADAGHIKLAGKEYIPQDPLDALKHGVAFIHQELNLFTNLTVAENIFITSFPKRFPFIPLIDKGRIRAKAKTLLEAVDLHISPNTLVEDLSQGERQLVEIAKALSVEAKIIIFDEPTTSLTSREKERLFTIIEKLRAQGVSIIYISHVLEDIFRLCDDLVVLRDGSVVGSGSNEEFTMEKLISLMVGRTLDQLYPTRTVSSSDEPILEVKSLSQPGIVKDINFTLYRGEVLGIAGLMGAGRSELARILFGLDPYEQGSIHIKGDRIVFSSARDAIQKGMAFLTENRREEGLLMDASIADNIALVSLKSFVNLRPGLIDSDRLHEDIRSIAKAVRINSTALKEQAVKSLSGGNQQKVVIAKWLLEKPSIFILDEPTRGIDVGAKYEIYTLINDLAAQGTGIIVISSEIEELIGICDRILVMSNGEIKGSFRRDEFDRERILQAALHTTIKRDEELSFASK
jgi:ribose transport system ATP-binding protein